MGIFNKRKVGGFMDVIRCDTKDYLIWKWHPNGHDEGKLKRETAIRRNSVLRVKEGEVAVFAYKQKGVDDMDYIVGPCDQTLKTMNLPVLSSFIGSLYEGDTPFQAEVFFINLNQANQIRFGIPYFDVTDHRYPDFSVPVSVRGSLTFKIEDYKMFVKCHQLATFSIDELRNKISSTVVKYVKQATINAPAENNIPLINIESKIDIINEKAEVLLKERLKETFAVSLTALEIDAIELDKESEGYAELKHITKDLTLAKTDIDLKNYEETLHIQREEGRYAQHMATKQNNLGAYQTEVSAQVGIAGAEALGKMGENNVGNVNMGGGSAFNPMSMMAGITLGNAVGQKMASTLNNAMSPNASVTPPPVPTTKYYVAKDGQPSGPYDVDTLRGMVASNSFKADSLVWKEGMNGWEKASTQSDLKGLFPPEMPK